MISPFYDPMIAKCRRRGDDRDEAGAAGRHADEASLAGPDQRRLLFAALSHPAFVAATSIPASCAHRRRVRDEPSTSAAPMAFRRGPKPSVAALAAERCRRKPGRSRFRLNDRAADRRADSRIRRDDSRGTWRGFLRLRGRADAWCSKWPGGFRACSARLVAVACRRRRRSSRRCRARSSASRFPAGEAVTKGQSLLVLEAMKMEHGLVAPFDGVAAELNAAEGGQGERGHLARSDREGGGLMPGRYFDEWAVGDTLEHQPHRTVTETDNLLISTLTTIRSRFTSTRNMPARRSSGGSSSTALSPSRCWSVLRRRHHSGDAGRQSRLRQGAECPSRCSSRTR